MKHKLTVLLVLAAVLFLFGCTSFHVKQSGATAEGKIVSTDLRATAWFSSAQHLEKLKALQTDKTQSFGTMGFDQQGATNTAATLQALANLLQVILASTPK